MSELHKTYIVLCVMGCIPLEETSPLFIVEIGRFLGEGSHASDRKSHDLDRYLRSIAQSCLFLNYNPIVAHLPSMVSPFIAYSVTSKLLFINGNLIRPYADNLGDVDDAISETIGNALVLSHVL